jgi:hypothetical protein
LRYPRTYSLTTSSRAACAASSCCRTPHAAAANLGKRRTRSGVTEPLPGSASLRRIAPSCPVDWSHLRAMSTAPETRVDRAGPEGISGLWPQAVAACRSRQPRPVLTICARSRSSRKGAAPSRSPRLLLIVRCERLLGTAPDARLSRKAAASARYLRPPNSQSWISTFAYSPALTRGAPASTVSTAARSRISISATSPSQFRPSSERSGPHAISCLR